MSSTTETPTGLDLDAGHVVTGAAPAAPIVATDDVVVLSAVKHPDTVRTCVRTLRTGGICALLPPGAAPTLVETLSRSVQDLASSRPSTAGGGLLALPTSGTTGTPKLVALPAEGIIRFLDWARGELRLDIDTVALSLSPWNFDVSLLDTWAVLAAGGTVVAADPDRLRSGDEVADLLDRHDVTLVQVVPATLEPLLDAVSGRVMPSVRDVVLTGGSASLATRARAAETFPAARFHHVYGATEVNDCLLATLSATEFGSLAVLPLGRAIEGCDVVLDSGDAITDVDQVAIGTEGRLLARTPWMAAGHVVDGVLVGLVDGGADGGRHDLGDRARRENVGLVYLGREDRQVKVRGQRISLDDVEAAALSTGLCGQALAWVEETAEALHLAVTPAGFARTSGLALRVALAERLPTSAIPNHLHALDRPFPLNGNGKPDRTAITTLIESE